MSNICTIYIYVLYCSFFTQSLNIQEEMEVVVAEQGGSGNVEISTSHPQSSSMDQESEDSELVRQIINNPLVSFVLLNTN